MSDGVGAGVGAVPCTVVAADPPRAFAWAVGDSTQPSATWSYDLVEDGGGTRVTQRFQHGPGLRER